MRQQLLTSSSCKFGQIEANNLIVSSFNHRLLAKWRDFIPIRGFTTESLKEVHFSTPSNPIYVYSILISFRKGQFSTSANKVDSVSCVQWLRFIDTKDKRYLDNSATRWSFRNIRFWRSKCCRKQDLDNKYKIPVYITIAATTSQHKSPQS
jgi:hypothetical protein